MSNEIYVPLASLGGVVDKLLLFTAPCTQAYAQDAGFAFSTGNFFIGFSVCIAVVAALLVVAVLIDAHRGEGEHTEDVESIADEVVEAPLCPDVNNMSDCITIYNDGKQVTSRSADEVVAVINDFLSAGRSVALRWCFRGGYNQRNKTDVVNGNTVDAIRAFWLSNGNFATNEILIHRDTGVNISTLVRGFYNINCCLSVIVI
jgi:hypothetical protein